MTRLSSTVLRLRLKSLAQGRLEETALVGAS